MRWSFEHRVRVSDITEDTDSESVTCQLYVRTSNKETPAYYAVPFDQIGHEQASENPGQSRMFLESWLHLLEASRCTTDGQNGFSSPKWQESVDPKVTSGQLQSWTHHYKRLQGNPFGKCALPWISSSQQLTCLAHTLSHSKIRSGKAGLTQIIAQQTKTRFVCLSSGGNAALHCHLP